MDRKFEKNQRQVPVSNGFRWLWPPNYPLTSPDQYERAFNFGGDVILWILCFFGGVYFSVHFLGGQSPLDSWSASKKYHWPWNPCFLESPFRRSLRIVSRHHLIRPLQRLSCSSGVIPSGFGHCLPMNFSPSSAQVLESVGPSFRRLANHSVARCRSSLAVFLPDAEIRSKMSSADTLTSPSQRSLRSCSRIFSFCLPVRSVQVLRISWIRGSSASSIDQAIAGGHGAFRFHLNGASTLRCGFVGSPPTTKQARGMLTLETDPPTLAA